MANMAAPELPFLVRLFATTVAGAADAERLTADVRRIVETKLQRYPWTGNLRELKGCVSNVYEQREYEPPSGYEPTPSMPRHATVGAASAKSVAVPSTKPNAPVAAKPATPAAPTAPAAPAAPAAPTAPAAPGADLARAVMEGTISMAELRQRYIVHTHAQTGSYTEAAKRLGIDWRTVRSAVEMELAARRPPAPPEHAKACSS